ncbi:hypothetical protein C8T65DRAFT_743242 [Cerioporus squamosus]|nr:hypothetical protein C8T65DRAFT_743242 [Cerioporus squamosus]
MQQNTALQPFFNLSHDFFDRLLIDVGQSASYQDAEDRILWNLSGWVAGDPRGYPTFRYYEYRLTRALRGLPSDTVLFASEPPADPDVIKAGGFAIYCALCPLPLLNEWFQDSVCQARLRALLLCPKSRRLTCDTLCSLARKEGCDFREILENTILLLAQHPDADFTPASIARAASELILISHNSGQDARATEAYRTAHELLMSTLRDRPATLPSLLPDIFDFYRLSLRMAKADTDEDEHGVEVELLPILMAFSKSRILSVRCLAVAALLALRPLDKLHDRGRYMIDGRRQVVRHERLAREHNSMAWQDSYDSPFGAFFKAWPTEFKLREVWEHYRGAETDWRAFAIALAESMQVEPDWEEPDDVIMNDTSEDDYRSWLEGVMPSVVDALDDDFDPEAATILRLFASLVMGNFADLWKQAWKAVGDHPDCAYVHCVLSLFPECNQGLIAAKEGLISGALPDCNTDRPHVLRDWLLRRASLHAWEQGLRLIRRANLSDVGSSAQIAAAFISSAHHDMEEIFGTRLDNENEVQKKTSESLTHLVWYILLSVALYGTKIPEDTKAYLLRIDFPTDPPPLEDAWKQYTPFYDVHCGSQEQEPWTEVVNHVDNLIEGSQGPGERLRGSRDLYSWLRTSKATGLTPKEAIDKTFELLRIPNLSRRSGLRRVHRRFPELAQNLNEIFDAARTRHNMHIVDAIMNIWCRLCPDAIICQRLIESGVLPKILNVLSSPTDVPRAFVSLSLISQYGDDAVRN